MKYSNESDGCSPKFNQEIKKLLLAQYNNASLKEKFLARASLAMIDAGFATNEVKDRIVRSLPGYKMGKYEGEKEGYIKAGKEYEDKLIKQASCFEEEKVSLKGNQQEFKKLIEDYEIYIREQEANFEQLSGEQQRRFEEIKNHYEKLLKINCNNSLRLP